MAIQKSAEGYSRATITRHKRTDGSVIHRIERRLDTVGKRTVSHVIHHSSQDKVQKFVHPELQQAIDNLARSSPTPAEGETPVSTLIGRKRHPA